MALVLFVLFCVTAVAAFPSFSKRQIVNPTFARIDVTGAHAFIAPGPNDLRGPCPALNALANHGYIARNGYTNIQEAADGIVKVYSCGMIRLFLFCLQVLGICLT